MRGTTWAWVKSGFSWGWSGLGNFVMIAGWLAGSAFVAWAVWAAGIMVAYQPFSWVAAGLFAAFALALSYMLIGLGRNLTAVARARDKLARSGDAIDPMDAIFQNKRIYISDLVNPFNQIVADKKFIRCELIGPANLVTLIGTGKFIKNHFSASDSIAIRNGAVPQNAILFVDCDFEECQFFRVSLLFQERVRGEADRLITGMNWLTGEDEPQLQIDDKTDKSGIGGFFRRLVGGDGEGRSS